MQKERVYLRRAVLVAAERHSLPFGGLAGTLRCVLVACTSIDEHVLLAV